VPKQAITPHLVQTAGSLQKHKEKIIKRDDRITPLRKQKYALSYKFEIKARREDIPSDLPIAGCSD